MNRLTIFLAVFGLLCLFSCQENQDFADSILTNGQIYVVEPEGKYVEALAIKDGLIVATGTAAEMTKWQGEATTMMDLEGAFAMPGFIEGHGHFSGLGVGLMNLNFLTSRSWEEIVQMVADKAASSAQGEWIVGRGWHQEKWDESPHLAYHGYPAHHSLSVLTKDHPVVLRHASGHSLFANQKAMDIAGVNSETPDPRGGHIVRDAAGEPIGVFEERAMQLIMEAYQSYRDSLSSTDLQTEWEQGVRLAQNECLAKGVTSFQDAGSSFQEIDDYERLAKAGKMDLRLWTMVRRSHNEMATKLTSRFPIIDAGNRFFTCRAIKTEVDGALGAFGAWLLAPYDDKPDFVGQNTTLIATVDSIAQLALAKDMQLCVHAIGDRANQEVLNLIEKHTPKDKTADLRWRIEHSQHLHPDDIPRFAALNVIPSMQAVHCTSDSPFVVKRLGEERARLGAYPWRSLLDAGAVVTNGTDVPVEDVDPLASYYAAVTRKRPGEDEAFFPEQAMTRAEAVYSYTMANAYAAFEEDWKGSLVPGKVADIVVLDQDILTCAEQAILDTKVLKTLVNGVLKFDASDSQME